MCQLLMGNEKCFLELLFFHKHWKTVCILIGGLISYLLTIKKFLTDVKFQSGRIILAGDHVEPAQLLPPSV